MHLLWVHEDLDISRFKTLKGCIPPSPVTCVSLLLNMVTILITKYVVLNFNRMYLCRFEKSACRLMLTVLESCFLFTCVNINLLS